MFHIYLVRICKIKKITNDDKFWCGWGKGDTKYSLPVRKQISKAIVDFSVAIPPKTRNEPTT